MKMHSRYKCLFVIGLVLAAAVSFGGNSVNAQKAAIGFNDLVDAVGPGLESGVGVDVSQIEANVGGAGQFRYLPDENFGQFAGKTIFDGSGISTGPSAHATTTVGAFFYGNASSIAPGVTNITGFDAATWINTNLGFAGNTDPLIDNFRVANHSYVSRSGFSDAVAANIMQRMDFFIDQSGTTVVVGADNQAALPLLFTQGYNSISVGRTAGAHSFGLTNLYGNGRVKPDIVAPASSTSRATAIVSSAAALLHEKATAMATPDAALPEVMKAIIMAGATKQEFPSWDRTTTRPIDEQFGAGELNIFNSYFIMEGGENDGETGDPTNDSSLLGWDYGETLDGGDSLFYDIVIDSQIAVDVSIMLAWNMEVTDNDATATFDPSFQLADLQLFLYDSTNGFMDNLIDSSISAVDNVEHIYQEMLDSGTYTIEVRNASGFGSDFGLAWRFSAVPEPSSALLTLLLVGGITIRRRRRSTTEC